MSSSTHQGRSSHCATTVASPSQNPPVASTTNLEDTHQYLLREISRFRVCCNQLSRLIMEKDAVISSQKATIDAQTEALGSVDIRLGNEIMAENEKTNHQIQTLKTFTEELARHGAIMESAAHDISTLTAALDAEKAETQRLREMLRELEKRE